MGPAVSPAGPVLLMALLERGLKVESETSVQPRKASGIICRHNFPLPILIGRTMCPRCGKIASAHDKSEVIAAARGAR